MEINLFYCKNKNQTYVAVAHLIKLLSEKFSYAPRLTISELVYYKIPHHYMNLYGSAVYI